MAKYNIIKNGVMRSTTTSGTGNKDLTGSELYKLLDFDTTSSGIQLINSDILYLDIDLGQRIKVDSIHIHADDLTKSSNITFSYKDEELDSYILCSKSVDSISYVATVPPPSAPQYIRCTVSGLDINLYELTVLNDDFIIEFGEDGSETELWLEDTPIGSVGIPQSIEIYNNSSSDKATTAYVCVDYTGNGKDGYVKICNTQYGTYEGIEDGAILGYKYKDWDTGSYSNTYKDSDETIKMTSTGYNYVFNNRIGPLPVQDQYIGYGWPFGYLNGWDIDHINKKIYVMFWVGTSSTSGVMKLYEYDITTNIWTYKSQFTDVSPYISRACMCYNNGYIYFNIKSSMVLYRHNLSGAQDNQEELSTTNVPILYNYASLLSDGGDYIYIYTTRDDDTSPQHQYFSRYRISNDTWYTLAVTTVPFQNSNYKLLTAYDDDRDVIYKYNTLSLNDWVSRYDVSSNTWTADFFNYAVRINSAKSYISMQYYNNKLYFLDHSTSVIHIYNIITDLVYTVPNFSYSPYNWHPYMLITDPTPNATASGVDDMSIFFAGRLYDYRAMYGYNTGVDSTYINTDFKSGTYTTPVISVDESYKASYFIIDGDTEEAKSSISTDDTLYNGTIEVRGSDTPPETINEVYWPYYLYTGSPYYYATYIGRHIVGTDSFSSTWKVLTSNSSANVYRAFPAAIDRRNGNVFSGYHRYDASSEDIYFKIYDRSGTELADYDRTNTGTVYLYSWKQPSFDGSHYIWYYLEPFSTLYHRDEALNDLGSRSVPSLFQLSGQLNGSGCWYTERSGMTLVKLLYDCSVDVTISLGSPYGVCGTEDNGCWVVDLADLTYGYTVKRYDVDGNLVNTILLDKSFYNLTSDNNDGFYTRSATTDGEIRHYTSTGVMDMKVEGLISVNFLSGGRDGVVAYSSSMRIVYYIDKATSSVIWTKDYDQDLWTTSTVSASIPALFSFDFDLQEQYIDDSGKLLPVSYDTIWYSDNNLEWQEVPKDGYFLQKYKYHQVRVTLRSLNGTSTPSMRSIFMVPALKLNNIYPQSSKSMYVRSDIPVNSSVSQFDTRLKVWWDIGE